MSVIDDELFDSRSIEELIAEGEYESDKDGILKGFKVFQRYYVYKSVALQLVIFMIGFLSQLVTVLTVPAEEDTSFSKMLMLVCLVICVYVAGRPRSTYKKLEKSLGELAGTVYKTQIYTNKIIITTIYDPYISDDEKDEKNEQETEDTGNTEESEEDKLPPATVIHLDNGAVEIVETDDMFVVYVKRVNIFVLPKSAFSEEEINEVKSRLSNIMGIRYKEK